jgi:hypothetical protein
MKYKQALIREVLIVWRAFVVCNEGSGLELLKLFFQFAELLFQASGIALLAIEFFAQIANGLVLQGEQGFKFFNPFFVHNREKNSR